MTEQDETFFDSIKNIVSQKKTDKEKIKLILKEIDKQNSEPEYGEKVSSGQDRRSYLLGLARTKYFKSQGMSEDDMSTLPVIEKNKHRDEINQIFYDLLAKENKAKFQVTKEKENLIEKIKNQEPDRMVVDKWNKERLEELNYEIEKESLNLDLLRKQNSLPKINPNIFQRNSELIKTSELMIKELENKKIKYSPVEGK